MTRGYGGNAVATMMIAVVVATSMVRMTTAKTIEVGGELGWKMPPNDKTFSEWASKQTFEVNDVLVFKFFTGSHSVAETTKAAYEKCDAMGAIKVDMMGPVSITLDKPGERYFICGIPGHCTSGQKLAVKVTAAGGGGGGSTSPSPAEAPTTSPATPESPPAKASASSTPEPKKGSSSSALLPDPLVYLIFFITAFGILIFV